MTELLQQAFERASGLPEEKQNMFAKFLISEIDDEKDWDDAFASSQSELARMAKDALAEYKTGKTEPLNLDRDF